MKSDWKKDEKIFYAPKQFPELVTIPAFNVFSIEGRGNPNAPAFSDEVGILYSLAYGVKMSPKAGIAPAGYEEYSVYPLEGLWDITEEAKKNFGASLDKNSFVYKLSIRQPGFVTGEFASMIIDRARKKNPNPLFEKVRFERLEEGLCVQMLHVGSYDDEPASFAVMEKFAIAQGLVRASRRHREIYLSDPKRTAPEKLRTVLRFQAKKAG
jgi:hypothetical protein